MLGDQIGEESGQVVLRRVLPPDGGLPCVEVTFEAHGRLLDVDHTDMGTYEARVRPDGTLSGTGQGLVRGANNETGTWRATGAGRLLEGGAVSWRGAIYYETASPALARLNGIAAIYEYEVDGSGKTQARIFEWK